MKKIISLILAIITFVASITFLIMFCSVQRIDKQINSQENINKIAIVKNANSEFVRIAQDLMTLYDSDDVSHKTLLDVQSSVNQLRQLESLIDTIENNLPMIIPLGNTDNETISKTSHSQTLNSLSNWQKDTITKTKKILEDGDSPFKKLSIQSKEYCDSTYRAEIDIPNTLTGVCDAGLLKVPENMKKIQIADAYIISCIGFAIISIASFLFFFCIKNNNIKLFVLIDLIVVFLFSVFTVLNLLGVFDNKSQEPQIPENNTSFTDGYDNNAINQTTPISEWGFNNLYELGNGLVQISGYNLEEGYVYYEGEYEGNIFKLENGYYIFQKVIIGENSLLPTYTTKYEVVNNDNFLLPGDGPFVVSKRDVVTNDFVILINENGGALTQWYVPYALIDWDKGIQSTDNGDEFKYSYKLYLK